RNTKRLARAIGPGLAPGLRPSFVLALQATDKGRRTKNQGQSASRRVKKGGRMRTLRRFFSRAVLGLLISVWQAGAPVNAVAADYYVSTTGSDSTGNGSSSNPWATIAFASTQIGPGSTVHVEAGTYTGSFSTNASGTSTAYVTYVSATKWGVKLVATSGSTWSNSGNYVAIVDFDVTGPVGGINGIFPQGNGTKI